MKLHWSPRSPYVRKVMILIHELGLGESIELTRSVAVTTELNPKIVADNPLNKIPTLILGDGRPLYDSPVICEYLASLPESRTFFRTGADYFETLRRQALGDGLLDLMIAWRGEVLRPEHLRSEVHIGAFAAKLGHCLDVLEADADALARAPFDIGHIATGCALAYIDFRFDEQDWRAGHPRLAAWHETFEARPSALAAPIIDD